MVARLRERREDVCGCRFPDAQFSEFGHISLKSQHVSEMTVLRMIIMLRLALEFGSMEVRYVS